MWETPSQIQAVAPTTVRAFDIWRPSFEPVRDGPVHVHLLQGLAIGWDSSVKPQARAFPQPCFHIAGEPCWKASSGTCRSALLHDGSSVIYWTSKVTPRFSK